MHFLLALGRPDLERRHETLHDIQDHHNGPGGRLWMVCIHYDGCARPVLRVSRRCNRHN